MDREWVDALTRRDGPALDSLMSDDFIFAYPMDGDSKTQFIADVESGDLRIEYLNRTKVEVNVFGPTAVLTALDDARWHYHGHDILGTYRVIHVYAKRELGWQIVAVQACLVS